VAIQTKLEVKGLRELQERLQTLAPSIARNALRSAVSAGATTIRSAARNAAPYYHGDVAKGHPPPGTLKRSIVQKQVSEQSSLFRQVYVVAVRKGKKYRNQGKRGTLSQDAYYWTWVEFGTSKMAAHSFMRPAFEAKKVAAVEAIKSKLVERIKQEVSHA
jgi:HK97 gp10 family phage protein